VPLSVNNGTLFFGILHAWKKDWDQYLRTVNLFEAKTQTFILRIWLEPREIKGAAESRRGVIEHIPSGERRYFTRIDEISGIIRHFLQLSGADLDERRSVFKWLKQIVLPKDPKSK
jgi:hypothetical protein